MSKKNEPTSAPQPEEETPVEQPVPAGEEASAPAESAAVDEAARLQTELAAEKDKYLRLAAEYDNFRRRSRTERENIYADVRADTVKAFLPVYDNLVRAVQHETDEAERQGAQAILTQFEGILDQYGVKPIEALGKKFDPALHNAVLHIEDEKYGESEIVLEMEKGFTMGDRVIRYSVVQVAN